MADRDEAETETRVGRPRDEEVTDAILQATLDEILERGYHGLRIERVASRVGCGKSTIYRRWPDKGELTAAALDWVSAIGELPDTGSLVDDLVEHAGWNIRNQDRTRAHEYPSYSALVAPEVRSHLWEAGFLKKRRDLGRAIIARAVERGDLPAEVDADTMLDAIAGIVLYRNAVRPVGTSEREIHALVSALVNTPPRTDRSSAH
ncbi:TetR/AcrR family transcriptional regulator [Microbacterium sp. KR10-403]|uniref:TetR/AcrR family transcriptional regulator n=1 Tax=Microbacterium sp. KR10-403 TaxID=3158581 RepID=UPI0032E4A898